MIFGTVNVHECEGCLLAHSLLTSGGRITKGTLITNSIALQLASSGITQVLVAQLETGDIHEDDAALVVAEQLCGSGVSLSRPRTGRVNVIATCEGLCHFDAKAIIDANCIDEGITIATLPENRWVAQGRMVATVKIIPYAVSTASVQRVAHLLTGHPLSVETAVAHKVVLVQTRLDSVKSAVLDKTRRITENRLTSRAATVIHESRCEHHADDLAAVIGQSLLRQPDWILIVGASAISDRADVIPQAIVKAGGSIDRYGIPVDPGNLLLLAHIGQTLIIGLPGCARSPRYNGLDMIFDRMACEIPVADKWLSSLAVGGLLTEIADRPAPRSTATDQRKVGVVILAAGSSKRAGKTNKLLVPYRENAMITHIAHVASASQASRVVVVTGHQQALVKEALSSTQVELQQNTAYESGMASSVVTGVSQLADTDGVLICLGDMPHITSNLINMLVQAFKTTPDKSIFVPVFNQQRGNPVLFGKVFFDTLLGLKGDTGARKLVQQYPDEVFEVVVDNNSILVDYDTQDELARLSKTRSLKRE